MLKKMWRAIRSSLKYTKENWKYDWGNLILFLVPVLMAIPKMIEYMDLYWYIPYILILIFLVGWIQTNSKKESIIEISRKLHKSEDEKEHLINNMESLPVEIIKDMYKYWKFDYDERITIYRYAEEHFVPVGRYSINQEYNQPGRERYSKDEGFIREAWRNGEFSIENLPDYHQNKERYIEYVSQKSNIRKGTLRNISMKSRSYFCKNLVNKSHFPIAVIVIESKKENLPITTVELSHHLEKGFGPILVNAIESILPLGGENGHGKNK